MSRVELRHLQFFLAVAEELSFTRASRGLHVVQSGVSSAIQGLERELGAPLFDRDRHRVALTDAGLALLPEARATLAAAQAAQDAVAQAQAGLRGTLTVGTMLSTGSFDLRRSLLGRFHALTPGCPFTCGRPRRVGGAGGPRHQWRTRPRSRGAARAGAGGASAAAAERGAAAPHRARRATRWRASAGSPWPRPAEEDFVDFPPGWGNRTLVDRAFAGGGAGPAGAVRGRRVHLGGGSGPATAWASPSSRSPRPT